MAMGRTIRVDPARIWALRQAKGWTQEELAERAGITQSSVQRMEREAGRRYRPAKVIGLARALGVDLRQLGVADEDADAVEAAEAAVREARSILRRARRRPDTFKSGSEYLTYPEHSGHRKGTAARAVS